MAFKILPASAEDIPDLAYVLTRAMSADLFWQTLAGLSTLEEQVAFNMESIRPRVDYGASIGACKTWKVVSEEEDGKVVAWGGLGIPCELTEEQRAGMYAQMSKPTGGNEKLSAWFKDRVLGQGLKGRYDPERDYRKLVSLCEQFSKIFVMLTVEQSVK
jgi:hypothetical protein